MMWIVTKFNYDNERLETIGCIDLPSECMGDDLYDKMVEMDWIDSIDNYEVDGNDEHVAVMGNAPEYGEFHLLFYPNDKLYFQFESVPGTISPPGEGLAYDAEDPVDFEPLFESPDYDSSFPVEFGDLKAISEEEAQGIGSVQVWG